MEVPEITVVAITQWLHSVANNEVEEQLKQFLAMANGDIDKAVDVIANPENDFHTGHYGATLDDGYSMAVAGSVRSKEFISIYHGWIGADGKSLPPVASISIRDVFVFIKNGNKLDVQLTLM